MILINLIAAAHATGADSPAPVRAELARELVRATQLENQGNVREAERLLIRIIRDVQSPAGSGMELAVALNNLGVLYVSMDRYADAEQQFLRALRILKANGDEASVQLAAKTTLGLASLYNQCGRNKETSKLDIPGLVGILKAPEDQARARTALASVHAYRGDLEAAERLYLEVLSFWQSPDNGAGGNAIEIGTILNNLAVIALRQRRYDIARDRIQRSLASFQQSLGPESPIVVKNMTNVAAVYTEMQRHDEAVEWLARAWSSGRRTLGELHPFVVTIQFAYADALKKVGRKSEAGEMRQAAAEARRMSFSHSISDRVVDYRDLAGRRR